MNHQAATGEATPLPWANGSRGYGLTSRIVHWTTAILIIGLVLLGLYSTQLLDGPARDTVLMVHKSFGLVVILLAVFQLCWTRLSRAQVDNSKLAGWEVAASHVGHVLLYAVMILMPVSGLIMSEGSGREVGFFNLVNLPQFLPIDPALPGRQQYYYKLGKFLHDKPLQWALYAIVALHLAGVVKHVFWDGDRAFIRRMWGLRDRRN